jgi:poly-gamma-glutamate capsule biosynthesis protein CapA/YwtB (metallophosphatase superfamily)
MNRWLRSCWAAAAIIGAGCGNLFASPSRLPIYIEESHAGSFYFLAEHLDLDRPHTFVLLDAHSDASAIFNSDAIRTAIRSVDVQKADLFRAWRQSGKIQCYNWIEPLMPRPFAQAIWVPSQTLDAAQIFHLENQCRLFLDAHEEVCPRIEQDLSHRYRVIDLTRLKSELPTLDQADQPIVVSIDLDFFAQTSDVDLEPRFKEVFLLVLRIKNLAAVTFSISTPYLRDTAQAERLLNLALEYSCRVANADIEFEPFATTGTDTSLRANELRNANLPIPKISLDQLSESTRNTLVRQAERLKVTEQSDRWHQFLTKPAADTPEIRFEDRIVEHSLTLSRSDLACSHFTTAAPPDAKSIHWYRLRSTADSYSISEQEFGFADGAPHWIYREPVPLSDASILQGSALLNAFDSKTGYGAADLFVQIETEAGVLSSKTIRIVSAADSVSPFQQALSSEFNLPYIFFGSNLARAGATGPEVGLGADCANFIIYGLRQTGWQIPWSDAKHLIPKLDRLAKVDLDQSVSDPTKLVQLPSADFRDGVIVVFENHVAALWQPQRPGFLGLNDLMVHQLEGQAEIVPLAELTKNRRHFSVLTVPHPERTIQVLVGGDVMLGRTNADKAIAGTDLFLNWEPTLAQADLAFANLECSLCASSLLSTEKLYRFRAPVEAGPLLAKAHFCGMLVANNHTGDFGLQGFEQTISALRRAGVAPIGGGLDRDGAVAPARFERKKIRVTVFGCADPTFCSPIVNANQAGMCPWDSETLVEELGQAAKAGEFCIVLCHWDADANRAACRDRAAEWIDAGANVVIGSGPHHVLDREMVKSRPVFYSAGNFLFDGGGPDREWSRSAMVELTISYPNSLVRARIVDRGRNSP